MSRSFSSLTLRRLLPVLAVTVLALPSLSQAGKWKADQQLRAMAYTMKVTTYDRRGRTTEGVLGLDVRPTEKVDAAGKVLWSVKTTQERLADPDSLKGAGLVHGLPGGLMGGLTGVSMQAAMYKGFLSQLELAEGEKLAVFGGMLLKVTGKETIAGIEGYVVKVFRTQNDQETLLSEMVLNEDIPVALRSRNYSKDKLQSEVVLLSFKFHE